MTTTEVKISDIKPNPNNPRLIKDEKFKRLVESVKNFPEMLRLRPIVVNEENVIIGGNMRWKAAKEAGYKTVPVTKAVGLTEEQEREFIIKDNVGFGEWDWEMLGNEWESEKLEEWGVDLPDMDVKVLDAEEDDYEVPEQIKTDIVTGDLFEIGQHRLLCGDSTNSDAMARLMNGQMAEMMFTDPPYGVNYTGGHFHSGDVRIKRKRENIKHDDSAIIYSDFLPIAISYVDGPCYMWFAGTKGHEVYNSVIENNCTISALIIWNKINAVYAAMNSQYKNRHEPCLYFKPNKSTLRWIGPSDECTIWDEKRDARNDLHPTQKPIVLPARAIKNHDAKIVLDCFLGSGSTMVAAHQLGRKCYGMELDPKYCQVIVERMHKLDPSLDIKRNGQPYKIEK